MEASKKHISSYTDPALLRQLMANAKKYANEEVYWQAFRRLCDLEGKNYNDPLEREFYATLAAYEELLAEKHDGKRIRASRTWQKLRNKGFIACLEDWALSSQRTEGFSTLVHNGHIELTGEYLVTKYPDRFSAEAVRNAQMIIELVKNNELKDLVK